ncbi:MAG: hypothetical protein KDD58_07855 [Bdellovibrionales bacterium]|nr:hypothetical protein [Bdellovibrionales bacterium]
MSIKRTLFNLLPLKYKEGVFLNKLKPFSIEEFNNEFEVKVAETKNEILQAYRLIYQNYYDSGICELEDEDIRITKHALLPTTTLVIVKHFEEVVATASIVVDNPLGLPLESLFNLDILRKTGKQIAEISTLSVKIGYRKLHGKILFPLTCYLFDYSSRVLGIDYFVLAVNPFSQPFYTSLFNAKKISSEVKKYSQVKNAQALAMYIDISEEIEEFIGQVKFGKGRKETLVNYFNPELYKSFKYPNREFYKAFNPAFKLELLKEIFSKKLKSLDILEEWDKEILQNIYSFNEFSNFFSNKSSENRVSPRFNVNCSGVFTSIDGKFVHFVRIYNISNQGIFFHPIGVHKIKSDEGEILLKISKDKSVSVNIKILREKNHQYGAKVLSSTPQSDWLEFIDYLSESFLQAS